MADYINRNILCQAYVHVEVEREYEESVQLVVDRALPLVLERAEFFLFPEARVEFTPTEGSVKSRITIFGSLILALQGIANYKDFREGIVLLKEDVERVATVAVTETLFALQARNKEIVRIEVRTGVVGSLRRIIADIDRITAENGVVSSRAQSLRLKALRESIEEVIDNIHDADDVELVRNELFLLIQKLPGDALPGPREKSFGRASIDAYRRRRSELVGFMTAVKKKKRESGQKRK